MDLFSIPTHLADFKKLLAEMNEKLDRIVTVVEHTHGVVSEVEQKISIWNKKYRFGTKIYQFGTKICQFGTKIYENEQKKHK